MITDKVIEPIIEFESKEEAGKCLKEWQHRLYLDNWIIALCFAEYKDMPRVGDAGDNDLQIENQCAVITLCTRGADDGIMKFCQEKVLVHELLHCRYDWLTGNTYEGNYLAEVEHQNLEMMARSLIMAKYNISSEWFNTVV